MVLCVDEKTQIQALDRMQPVLPMRPGLPERRTHDYRRHGTTSLFAALNVATGAVVKYHVEFCRRHKFDPCSGCLFFHFKDCWPAITASVVDYYGEKKKAWYTLRRAFSPLHVMMEWPDLWRAHPPAPRCARRCMW